MQPYMRCILNLYNTVTRPNSITAAERSPPQSYGDKKRLVVLLQPAHQNKRERKPKAYNKAVQSV